MKMESRKGGPSQTILRRLTQASQTSWAWGQLLWVECLACADQCAPMRGRGNEVAQVGGVVGVWKICPASQPLGFPVQPPQVWG
jgi:hypothetical protein